MVKKELRLHSVVSPTETVVVSAYDKVADAFKTGMEQKRKIDEGER